MRQATRQRFDKAPSERERGEQEEQTYEEQGRVRNTNSSNLIERKWLQRILLTTPMPIRAIRWDNAVITNHAARWSGPVPGTAAHEPRSRVVGRRGV